MLIEHYFSQLLTFSSTPQCKSLSEQSHINIEKSILPLYPGIKIAHFRMTLPLPVCVLTATTPANTL